MDRTPSADPRDIQNMLTTHLIKLRRNPVYKNCVIRIAIEANYSQIDANRVQQLLTGPQFGDVQWVHKDPTNQNRVGIWTSEENKKAYAMEMQRAIGHLYIAKEYLSMDESPDKCCILELYKQLKQFRFELREKVGGGGEAKGRLTGKGMGKKDDLAMAMGIWLHFMYMAIYNDESFANFCVRNKLVFDDPN
jgi:hypothetical protein